MVQVWKVNYSGEESLLRQFNYNYQGREFAEDLTERGFVDRLVVIDDNTDNVIFDYTPISWKETCRQ